MTPAVFFDFIEHMERHGKDEALKMISFEQYNKDFLLELIKSNGWTGYCDLVHGGHVKMIVSEKERVQCQADFEAAKAAGYDASQIQWLSESESDAASRFSWLLRHSDSDSSISDLEQSMKPSCLIPITSGQVNLSTNYSNWPNHLQSTHQTRIKAGSQR